MSTMSTSELEKKASEMKLSTNQDKKPEKQSKLAAAAALAGLVDSPSPQPEAQPEQKMQEAEFRIPQRFTRSGRKRAVSFPLKLMKVLSKKEFNDIITWMPSGKSFNIIDSKRFTAEILPEYFKSAKYSSFTRKLHRWGFVRHYRGDEAGAFFHKDFQKARPDLVEEMTCLKQESLGKPMAPRRAAPSIPTAPAPLPTPPTAARSIPMAQMAPVAPPMPSRPVDINAAIEMEVARRVQERIDLAAMRRLAIMRQEQQMIQEQDFLRRQEQQLLAQERQLVLQQQARQLQFQQHSLVNPSLLLNLPKPAPAQLQTLIGGSSTTGLPQTNTFGAKTA